MKVAVIGSGYVGLVTGACFTLKKHEVVLVDVVKEKVDKINKGILPIYEPGLDEIVKEALEEKLLKATTDYKEALENADMVFIAVPTPSKEDGSLDVKYIEQVASQIAETLEGLKPRKLLLVMKSTVLPGTTENIFKEIIINKVSEEWKGKLSFAMNPEFLREGIAVEDFLNPDRVVIGIEDDYGKDLLSKLYLDFVNEDKILITPIKVAELIKYASNAFLAMKISFANEIGNLSKSLGIDVYQVMDGVGMDKRIGRAFLNAGLGFGGSCFPKDVSALLNFGRGLGHKMLLLDATLQINKEQPKKLVDLALKRYGSLKDKEIVVLGLAFKPNTDDIRESKAIELIKLLLDEGIKAVHTYDPAAMENAKKYLSNNKIKYHATLENALSSAEIVFIATEWQEFKNEDLYEGKEVFDGRRVIEGKKAKYYEGICW
ncbi:MAG: UDP-glucose/GDP-mannose dehydrogenase family protein [Candidatus Nanohaloarchaeota archaeon]|nr:UDP-glucose/GDP-mannose dehydrogenase family protein [Candidatus Nanohaloarchaeota archaeon]